MVRESPLWVLSKSCTPKSASSKLICFKTAVGVIYACSAALLKLPASATRINVSSCGLYIASLPFLRFSVNISDYLFHNNISFAEKAIKLLLLGNFCFSWADAKSSRRSFISSAFSCRQGFQSRFIFRRAHIAFPFHILPVPHNRSRIKINYGFISKQYLVSYQLDNTISIAFYLFQNIFKYFPARRVFLYKTFSGHPDEVFRSLKTEEHMPSCIWDLMAGFLHRVYPARMKSHTVQPVNAAGEGTGNGDGRYV